MPTTKSRDGVEIAYREFGSGPTAVIFVHGWMVSGAVYDDCIEALGTKGLRIVVPDHRGTGSSGRPEGGYTIEQYAADVVAVADAAKVDRFTVVGSSMGGQIALWIAATQPQRVTGAVLLSPVPPSGVPMPEDVKTLFRTCAEDRGKQAAILASCCKELTDAARDRLVNDGVRTARAAIEQGYDAFSGASFADKLGSVTAPALVVATDDPFFPRDFLDQTIASKLSRGHLAYLPGPGHYLQVERPRETAALIRAFVAPL